jgi:hypothetical protein
LRLGILVLGPIHPHTHIHTAHRDHRLLLLMLLLLDTLHAHTLIAERHRADSLSLLATHTLRTHTHTADIDPCLLLVA